MTALLGFIMPLVSSVFGALAARLGLKIALNATVIGVWVVAAAAFAATLNTLAGSLIGSMPSLVAGALTTFPDNTGTCIAAIISGDIAAYVYRQIVIIASFKSRV